MSVSVLPSYPAPSLPELERVFKALDGVVYEFQVDLVDGRYAPSVSWPFYEVDVFSELASLKPYTEVFELEFDCMVVNPIQYVDTFGEIGASRVVIHYGSTDNYAAVLEAVRNIGARCGLAFTNDAAKDNVRGLVEQFDYVQVMGIKTVGAQGQPFDKRTIATVEALRDSFPKLEIAVDGGVNEDTIEALVEAGATRLAPGSAITQAKEPEETYKHLFALANHKGSIM